MKRLATALMIVALVAVSASQVAAKKPSSPSGATIWFTNASPHFGDEATFGYTYSGKGVPDIHVICYPSNGGVWGSLPYVPVPGRGIRFGIGGVMLSSTPGVYPGPWVAGVPASCTASLTIANRWGTPIGLASSAPITVW